MNALDSLLIDIILRVFLLSEVFGQLIRLLICRGTYVIATRRNLISLMVLSI